MSSRRRLAWTGLAATAVTATAVSLPSTTGSAAAPTVPGFSHFTVDHDLAGGEPFVAYSARGSNGPDLVYTAHEGTTHLFRDGIVQPSTVCDPNSPPGTLPASFTCSYRNEVNVWTSDDQGANWRQTSLAGVTGVTGPSAVGFSDPDLTADESGTVYDSGIDLANDAVFFSTDGGKSFPAGSNNCQSGDRPWLAGGVANEVFLATDTTVDPTTDLSSGYEIFHGVVTGAAPATTLVCSGAGGQPDPTGTGSTGIKDFGPWQTTGSYSAAGKLLYDHNALGHRGSLVDPAIFSNSDGSQGVGISVLPNAAQAFTSGGSFTPLEVPMKTTVFAHWPAIALDASDVVYLVWDTADGTAAGLTNSIMLTSFDLKNPGAGFTTPVSVAHPGTTVLWPWVAVGDTGNAAVVWYQYDSVVNPDSTLTGKVSVMESTLSGANTSSPTVLTAVDAVGAPIHSGGICQGGTTCVATGQDRRLGDFFTDAVDENGCVMVATGETASNPTAATSRPLYVQQTSGTGLSGKACTALAAGIVPESRFAPALVLGGITVAALMGWRRRRLGGARER